MRSAVIAAAFAACAVAVPHQKRDVVTDTDVSMVYVTDVVTVTGDGATPTPAQHWGHSNPHWGYPHWSSGWSSGQSSVTTKHHGGGKKPKPSTPTAVTTSTEAAPTTTEAAPTTTPTSTEAAPTTTETPQSTKQAPTTTESGSVPTSYSEITVYHHNIHRSNHSAPTIEWSDDLASSAATIAASCVYAHNVGVDGGGYGQNIAAGVEANNISAIITDLFYNGEVNWFSGLYGEANPSMTNFDSWGHFSQIVWKATTHVGCATQDCTGQGLANVASDVSPYFTVCNYKSPGNYGGEYGENIGEPLGEPTAQWNTGL